MADFMKSRNRARCIRLGPILSALMLYESNFLNADGSRGILVGPHKIVTDMYNDLGCNMNMGVFFVVTSY